VELLKILKLLPIKKPLSRLLAFMPPLYRDADRAWHNILYPGYVAISLLGRLEWEFAPNPTLVTG
jgi:hypothetical protein